MLQNQNPTLNFPSIAQLLDHLSKFSIGFFFAVTIAIIPDVLVTNLITKL